MARSRLRQGRDQGGRCDQIEPITGEADDLSGPQETKSPVIAYELQVAGFLGVSIFSN